MPLCAGNLTRSGLLLDGADGYAKADSGLLSSFKLQILLHSISPRIML